MTQASEPAVEATSTEPAEETTTSKLAEATVVARAQDGDPASFDELVRRYQRPLFRLAHRLLSDRGEAEDAVQETFVAVWRRLPTLVEPLTFRGWIYQITTRRCLRVLRDRGRRQTAPADDVGLESSFDQGRIGPQADSTARAAQHSAQLQGLDAALMRLGDEQRACWMLRELHDLSYAEIARAIEVPQSTVRSRLARARENLMEGLAGWR